MKLPHLTYLDGWRGIAILLVLGGHFLHLPAQRLGVEVFFVLSGLLMSRLLFDARVPLGLFYKRRIARIFPVFFLYLGIVAIAAATLSKHFFGLQFLYNAIFIQSYMPASVPADLNLPLGHLWSLNVEEHSYVFLSLVALATRDPKIARIALTAAACLCAGMYAVYHQTGYEGIFRTECAAFPLLASAALHLWLGGFKRNGLLFGIASTGFVLCILVSRSVGGSVAIDYVIKTFCIAVMVNTLHAAPEMLLRALSARWLQWFGLTSFSIYVWQQPFYHWVLGGRLNPIVGLAAAIAVGAASYYFFERPLRAAIRDWSPGRAVDHAKSAG